jgi:hypothetical protein
VGPDPIQVVAGKRKKPRKGVGKMKRTVLAVTALLTVATAQVSRAQVTLGFGGGMSHTSANLTDEYGVRMETDALSGLVAGLFGEVELTPHLALRLGAVYAEGGSTVYEPEVGVMDAELTFSFLEFPVFLKAALGGAVSPYLLGGFSFGIKTAAHLSVRPGFLRFAGDASPIVEDRSWAMGLGAGVETSLKGGTRLSLEGQFLVGLRDTLRGGRMMVRNGFAEAPVDIPRGSDYRDRGFRVQIGWAYPVG